METVWVRAHRNLDFLNAGEPALVDRDEQVERLLGAGELFEVDAPMAEQTAFPGLAEVEVSTDEAPAPKAARGR